MKTQQLFTRVEIKAVDTAQRLIDGHAAAFSNKDRVGDIIDTGAFDRTLKENDDVLVFIGHDSSRLPVGEPARISPDAKGLFTSTRVYNTPAGDELLEVAKQRMASGKTLGMSIGYRTVKDRYSQGARHLLDVDLVEYSFLASPMLAANPEATVTGVKRHKNRKATTVGAVVTYDDSYEDLQDDLSDAAEEALGAYYVSVLATFADHVVVAAPGPDEVQYWDFPYTLDADGEPVLGTPTEMDQAWVPASAKMRLDLESKKEPPSVKVLTAEQKAALPDSAFAFIEPGGTKDDGGLTMPRASRHFPHHAADGSLDTSMLESALREAETSDHGSKALAHLQRHASKAGLAFRPTDGMDDAHSAQWAQGAAPALLVIAVKIASLAEDIAHDRQAMERLGLDTKGGERLNQAVQQRLKALHATIGHIVEQAESVERGEDGTAQVDLYRYAFDLLNLEEVA